MLNLEYLEIVGGCVEASPDPFHLPRTWQIPQYPTLRTLRLESIYLTPRRLARLQALSREITHLELIDTSRDALFPVLASGVWALRAALDMAITPFILPPSALKILPFADAICNVGMSRGLIDGLGQGFFVDGFDQRAADFEYVAPPAYLFEGEEDYVWPADFCCAPCLYEHNVCRDQEKLEEEIQDRLKMSAALSRIKGMKEAETAQRKCFKTVAARFSIKRRRIHVPIFMSRDRTKFERLFSLD
ncbi:hypothetical protein C8R43DRAFT_1130376 [Mycena crocata]|nr:hypothetical protein C8R43DRAFT_1130376 [Mycena crocata]